MAATPLGMVGWYLMEQNLTKVVIRTKCNRYIFKEWKMKKLLIVICLFFIWVDIGIAASARSYDENTDPSLTDDFLIGIDNYPAEPGWSVERFNLTNIRALFLASPTLTGTVVLPSNQAFLGSPTFQTSIEPAVAGVGDLGATDKEISAIYLKTGGIIYGGDTQAATITESSGGWILSGTGDGGTVNIGPAAADDTEPTLVLRGDADEDAGDDIQENVTLTLTPAADPTNATWNFTSTQSAGYVFDKNISAATYGSDGSVSDAELLNIGTIGATTISANQWAALGGIAETLTSGELDILDGVTATYTELNYLDIASLGTGVASKAVVLDGSGNYTAPAGTWDFTSVTGLTFGAQPITTTGKITPNGGIAALIPVTDTAANFAGNFTGANLYGGTFVATTTGTATLPAPVAGMNFTIITLSTGGAITITPTAGDDIILDGTQLDDNHSALNASTAGDIAVVQYYDADGWLITTNGWTEVAD